MVGTVLFRSSADVRNSPGATVPSPRDICAGDEATECVLMYMGS